MARKPFKFSALNTWDKHVDIYKNIFILALQSLSKYSELPRTEPHLNAIVYKIVADKCKAISQKTDAEIPAPLLELPNQDADAALSSGIDKLKRPDFTCAKFDVTIGCNVYLAVEAKLLGEPTSPNWVLNKNYVQNGIQRFDSAEHEYGKDAHSGIMLGYIISMAPQSILEDINNCINSSCTNVPIIRLLCNRSLVTRLSHAFTRTNVSPCDFMLLHLWVDIRKCIQYECPTQLSTPL